MKNMPYTNVTDTFYWILICVNTNLQNRNKIPILRHIIFDYVKYNLQTRSKARDFDQFVDLSIVSLLKYYLVFMISKAGKIQMTNKILLSTIIATKLVITTVSVVNYCQWYTKLESYPLQFFNFWHQIFAYVIFTYLH